MQSCSMDCELLKTLHDMNTRLHSSQIYNRVIDFCCVYAAHKVLIDGKMKKYRQYRCCRMRPEVLVSMVELTQAQKEKRREVDRRGDSIHIYIYIFVFFFLAGAGCPPPPPPPLPVVWLWVGFRV